MNKKIKIARTLKCDTRSGNIANVSDKDVLIDTLKHKYAVKVVYDGLFKMGSRQISIHDFTKIELLEMFADALRSGAINDEFREIYWFKEIHAKKERHHLNDFCPDDVNLIDVIEMIIDCVVAYLARRTPENNEFRDITISNDILQKAIKNTSKLLLDNIEVTDKEPMIHEGIIIGPYDHYDDYKMFVLNNL